MNYVSMPSAFHSQPLGVLGRVWQPLPPLPLPSVRLHGVAVVDASVPAVLAWLMGRIEAGVPTRLAFLNAHCANVARSDPSYKDALDTADAVLPDGSGLALAARLNGRRLTANLNGTDFVPALCSHLRDQGYSVYLLGGGEGVAEAAAAALTTAYPGLRIAGTAPGHFDAAAEDAVIERVRASRADVLLVARGVPIQDQFLARVSARTGALLSMGVGGLFDFLSGRLPRAPKAVRAVGCEWAWRLWQEPGRMWRRYVLGNPAYVGHAMREAAPRLRRQGDGCLRRLLDIGLSSVLLLLSLPVLLIMALLVRVTSEGPALFRQQRIGVGGREFTMLKFRSMYTSAEARLGEVAAENLHGPDGIVFKARGDRRVTPLGALLRRTSLDELPQLWNVLRGDMSLVGPRPPLPREVRLYRGGHWGRLSVKPGITCLWQVQGRSEIPFERQVELDLDYIRRQSVLLDLLILARTLPAVLAAKGAY